MINNNNNNDIKNDIMMKYITELHTLIFRIGLYDVKLYNYMRDDINIINIYKLPYNRQLKLINEYSKLGKHFLNILRKNNNNNNNNTHKWKSKYK